MIQQRPKQIEKQKPTKLSSTTSWFITFPLLLLFVFVQRVKNHWAPVQSQHAEEGEGEEGNMLEASSWAGPGYTMCTLW